MKRWLLSAVLLGSIVGVAQADYIIIIANLGLAPEDLQDPNQIGGGVVQPPAPAKPPAGGGAIGLKPGGLTDRPGAQPPQPGQGNPPAAGANDHTLFVTAVIEVERKGAQETQYLDPLTQQPAKMFRIRHGLVPGGGTSAFYPTDTIKLIQWTGPDGQPMPGRGDRWLGKEAELKKGKPTIEKVLEVAEWALTHGLVAHCAEVMTKYVPETAKDHPAVVAFRKVDGDLNRPVSKPDVADAWKAKLLTNYRITRSAHYALLHTANSEDAPEVVSRRKSLENTFRAFYYWFALKGKALPVPEQRLVAVLALKEEDFVNQHRIFDSPPRIADGFYAQRDNLLVLSGSSLDVGYRAMIDQSKDLWNTFNRDQMLNALAPGKAPKLPPPKTAEEYAKQQQDFKEASTKALFLKALELDSERATVSHDGTRQLVAASGLLPRTVAAPEWVQFGVGSFFETAKGSPWASVGVPSPTFNDLFNYLLHYRRLTDPDRNKLDKGLLLENIVTDRYFRQHAAKKDLPNLIKARSTAWALTYYLAHKRLDDLLGYYQELAQLPRDLEFDDETLLNCFGRAFKLMDDKQPSKLDRTKEGKFNRFAADFHDFVRRTELDDQMLQQVHKIQNELRGNPNDANKPRP